MTRANGNTFGNFSATQPELIANFDVIQTLDQADVYVFA